jgi:hypothetical protein
MENLRKAERWDRNHPDPTWEELESRPKDTKGAIARWRDPVRQLYEGVDIYQTHDQAGDAPSGSAESETRLHPNMPAVVVLLTPFAWMPLPTAVLVWNILKLAVLGAALLGSAAVVNHRGHRMPDWVLLLGLLWAALFVVGDIQHGNTNLFVLGAIVAHLWLYRRGRDVAAGLPLALAICLKMTPALFLVYWLYQRNWKLLGGAALGLALLAVGLPTAVLGPAHFADLTGSWWSNVIHPGLTEGEWYPIHINQSLPGVLSRYLLGGREAGDIFHAPDTRPGSQERQAWIAFASLSPDAVRWILRALQAVIVGLTAWAIGWRKLPRDDGRRALHWGIVLLAMMLLNQRTWDHHAAVLLPAAVAVWYAIAFGRVGPISRKWALGLMLAAGPLVWLTGTETFDLAAKIVGRSDETGEFWADLSQAWGLTFYHFALVFAVAVLLAVRLRSRAEPYAQRRLKLSE